MPDRSQLLDAPSAALRGPHQHLAMLSGSTVAYRPEISPLASIGPDPDARAWADLDALAVDTVLIVSPAGIEPGPAWNRAGGIDAHVMSDDMVEIRETSNATAALTDADLPEMLDLTARTQPGPFLPGTLSFGGYRGIRRDGRLAAMAGRRMQPAGWIEVSAVCTDPAYRGQGLARLLVLDVLAGIHAEGKRGFLHVAADNPARRLYEQLGFVTYVEAAITRLTRRS